MASSRTASLSDRPRAARSGALLLESAPGRSKGGSLSVSVASGVLKALSANTPTVRKVAETLGEAILRTGKTGKGEQFTVQVDPHGNIEISPGPEIAPPEAQTTEDAFEAARQRGRIRAAQILDQQDMLTADDFASSLGVSRVTVNARRQKHELLGLDGAKRGYRYPAWQVDDEGKAFEAMPRLFELLGPRPWGVYRFLTQRHNVLNGATGKDALRQGRTQAVLDAAESLARGDFA